MYFKTLTYSDDNEFVQDRNTREENLKFYKKLLYFEVWFLLFPVPEKRCARLKLIRRCAVFTKRIIFPSDAKHVLTLCTSRPDKAVPYAYKTITYFLSP